MLIIHRVVSLSQQELWCTACCRLGKQAAGSCVPAATAAAWTLMESEGDVPDDWADEDYVGREWTDGPT